jgi:hypothetical protein
VLAKIIFPVLAPYVGTPSNQPNKQTNIQLIFWGIISHYSIGGSQIALFENKFKWLKTN